jgi:hypothetical protein
MSAGISFESRTVQGGQIPEQGSLFNDYLGHLRSMRRDTASVPWFDELLDSEKNVVTLLCARLGCHVGISASRFSSSPAQGYSSDSLIKIFFKNSTAMNLEVIKDLLDLNDALAGEYRIHPIISVCFHESYVERVRGATRCGISPRTLEVVIKRIPSDLKSKERKDFIQQAKEEHDARYTILRRLLDSPELTETPIPHRLRVISSGIESITMLNNIDRTNIMRLVRHLDRTHSPKITLTSSDTNNLCLTASSQAFELTNLENWYPFILAMGMLQKTHYLEVVLDDSSPPCFNISIGPIVSNLVSQQASLGRISTLGFPAPGQVAAGGGKRSLEQEPGEEAPAQDSKRARTEPGQRPGGLDP